MRKTLVLAAIAAVFAVGCNKGADVSAKSEGSPSAPGNAQPAAMVDGFDLKGTYEVSIGKSPDSKDDLGQKLGEMFIGMMGFKLKIKDSSAYAISIMGIEIGGHYKVDGNHIVMTPETIAGMTIEEWKKAHPDQASKMGDNQLKEMDGTIDAKEQSITVASEKKDSPPLVFKKAAEEDVSKLPSTVAEDEKPFVGSYTGNVEADPAQFKTKEDKEFAETMFKSTSLDLRQNNSFKMHMVMDVGGKWKLENGSITLTMESVGGLTGGSSGSNQKPMVLSVSSDGKELTGNSPDGKSKITFTKN